MIGADDRQGRDRAGVGMKILITGAAGFIGCHLSEACCAAGHAVVGIDNLNDYYSPQLKRDRLKLLERHSAFRFLKLDLVDAGGLMGLFESEGFTHVVNLAAQAGVRYSLQNPGAYVRSNLVGFANLLEACRHHPVEHLVYASSSSVYGLNTAMPFRADRPADHQASLYAATKKSNEAMAHAYAHLYGMAATGLRLFTVYGPWGRPDMALFIFTKAILEGRAIPVFNEGKLLRDFTYIDDIVSGVIGVLSHSARPSENWNPEAPDPSISAAPHRLYNMGNNRPVALLDFIGTLESCLGRKAQLDLLPMQPGDVQATYADIEPLRSVTGFEPRTDLAEGIAAFVDWYSAYYGCAKGQN
jgi:UDP-glucuronate 4-epimerase